MLSTLLRASTIVLLGAFGAGCGLLHFGKGRQRGAANALFPEARRAPLAIGRVSLVNAEGRFALIEGNMVQPPVTGTTLRAYSGNSVSAELRATGVRRRPFVVADVVSGLPAKGDLVVQPPPDATPAPITAAPAAAATPAPEPRRKRWLGLFGSRQ